MRNQRAERGFTLIELIITVAIIGILSAIAIPGYKSYMESSRRATAQADMLELAQFMERRYTNGYDYRESGGGAPALPFTTAPRQGTPVYYNYSFDGNVERTKFKIQAVPAGPQTSDDCGTLTLDNTGTRGSDGATGDCWR